MIKKLYEYRYPLCSAFLLSLTTLMLLWEFVSLIPAVEVCSSNHHLVKVIIFFLMIVISAWYAYHKLFGKKTNLTLEINKRTKLTIQKNNLMAASGLKVIPVNEYFDTHNGDGIISPGSLHGQFNALFADDIEKLRAEIDKQLATKEPLPSNRKRTMVNGLPENRYPLGTCIRVVKDGQAYLLVALTRFNSEEHVEVATEEYTEIVRKLYNGIEMYQNGEPVYMPLLGSGISGYQLSNMQMLNTLILSAYNADKLAVTKGITICIYDDEQMRTLNLNLMEYFFNRWKTLK